MPSKRPSAQGDALSKLATQVVTLLKRPETQAAIAAAVRSSSTRYKQFTSHRASRPKRADRHTSDDRFSLPLSRERLDRRISAMEENIELLATELSGAVDLTPFDELLRKARLKLKVAEEMSIVKRTKVHFEVDDILDKLDDAVLAAVDGESLE